MTQCQPLYGGDKPAVYRTTTKVARKFHWCTECAGKIPPGEKYEHNTGLWDGSWSTHKTCRSCVEIRDHFSDGEGWTYGEVWNQIAENFFPDMRAGGPCMKGLSVAAIERLFAAKLAHDAEEDDWPNAHLPMEQRMKKYRVAAP